LIEEPGEVMVALASWNQGERVEMFNSKTTQ